MILEGFHPHSMLFFHQEKSFHDHDADPKGGMRNSGNVRRRIGRQEMGAAGTARYGKGANETSAHDYGKREIPEISGRSRDQ
jgi:hypothetical protein